MGFLEGLHHPEKYWKVLLKWGLLGILIGIMGGFIGTAFHYALHFVTEVREHHTWLIFLLPLGGLLSVGVYRVAKMTGNRGTNEVIDAILDNKQVNPLIAPVIFIASSITHLFGGSAGREGAALQLGGSTASFVAKLLKLKEKYTIVIVTHNLFQARRIADDCIFMLNGQLWEQNTTEELFGNPQRQETKDYLQGAYA